MDTPDDLKYTKDHEWIRLSGNKGLVGITDHAQSELGDITFIELPTLGQNVAPADTIASIESVKAASDIYAPLGGSISKINENLTDTPELINQSPYDTGWICEIDNINLDTAQTLMDAHAYQEYLKEHGSS